MDALPPISCYSLYGPMWQGIWETFYLVMQEGKPTGCLKKDDLRVYVAICSICLSTNVPKCFAQSSSAQYVWNFRNFDDLLHRCKRGINGR